MKREPCMTLKELAKLKGLTVSALTHRAAKVPYPEPAVFGKNIISMGPCSAPRSRPVQYRRSALLEWFDKTSEVTK